MPGASKQTPAVSVAGVSMRFDDFHAVRDASFELEQGRFLTILGPSGSGKTTLLRMIAGFLTPTCGEIFIKGEAVNAVAANRRSIGMVFQKLALFPHMTAADNVAFPLKMRRFDARTIPDRVRRYLKLVRLDGLQDRRIHELSGGQQQRVAIARALVFEPDLLLLDEPLAALDRRLREEMQLEFRRIQRELGVTTINVTHDQREALVVSDRIIVMDNAQIQQNAAPATMYRQPENPFVATFIGVTNLLPGKLVNQSGDRAAVLVGERELSGRLRRKARDAGSDLRPGVAVQCALRAERVRIASAGKALSTTDFSFTGRISDVIFEGERQIYVVDVPGLSETPLRILHHDQDEFATHHIGEQVHVGWKAGDMHVYAGS